MSTRTLAAVITNMPNQAAAVEINGQRYTLRTLALALKQQQAMHEIAELLNLSDDARRPDLVVAAIRNRITPPDGPMVESWRGVEHGERVHQFAAGNTTITFLPDAVELMLPEQRGGHVAVETERGAGLNTLRELRALLNDPRVAALLG
jgi:hypothetical protein